MSDDLMQDAKTAMERMVENYDAAIEAQFEALVVQGGIAISRIHLVKHLAQDGLIKTTTIVVDDVPVHQFLLSVKAPI